MYAVILAGGSGTRLWPLSRQEYPKYYLKAKRDEKNSLIEDSINRLNGITSNENILVITSQSQKDILETKLQNQVQVLGEPYARNTAPAIGLAAWYWAQFDPNGVIFVFPSDHYLTPIKQFQELLLKANKLAKQHGLVTFGIKPNKSETGYGYILSGETLEEYACKVDSFVEKPDKQKAQEFLEDGKYLWNSGMFALHISTLQKEFREFLPKISKNLDELDLKNFSNLEEIYGSMESISIDYGIMEKSKNIVVMPIDLNWTDLGTWDSYYEINPKDKEGNVFQGRVVSMDSKDSLVLSSDNRLIGVLGVDNLAIVDTQDATLVCDKSKSQEVKNLTELLKEGDFKELLEHEKVYKPWGSYEVLDKGENFKVKRLTISPGESISLQRHKYRSENWFIVQSNARITLDDDTKDYGVGESLHISAKTIHRVENIMDQDLIIIEVQNGGYLEEDDIERISEEKHIQNFNRWLNNENVDEVTKKELEKIKGDSEEIKDRFSQELEFGTGGLRGVVGAGINRMNSYVVRRAAQGLCNYLEKEGCNKQEKRVVIAYDSRHYSDVFAKETALVFAANGIKAYVFDDIAPTPLLSYAVRDLGCDLGIVITASHNPPEYNGFKVYTHDGGQAVPEITDEITKEIDNLDLFEDVKTIAEGEVQKSKLLEFLGEDIQERYIEEIKNVCTYDGKKDLNVVYTSLHGTGYRIVPNLLNALGYDNVFLPEEQNTPDPEFSTVKTPNPEEQEAFDISFKKAKQVDGDIIIATDPDSDRVGCAIRDDNGEYNFLNGNQTGVLLLYYILSRMENVSDNAVVIKTIVTSDLGREIAKDYNVKVEEVLTGFKFIAEKIEEYQKDFLFGYEESYGYLTDTFVRDKDGVMISALLVDMTAFYKTQGKTLLDVLEEIYQKYGYYYEDLITIKVSEQNFVQQMLEKLSNDQPEKIAGLKVIVKEDYQNGERTNLEFGETSSINLPKTKALKFILSDGSWFCVRPSGTEPKFKIYLAVKGDTSEGAESKLVSMKEEVSELFA